MIKAFFIIFIYSNVVFAQLLDDQFLTPAEAEKRWGNIPFNSEKFKNSDSNVRAAMTSSLINRREFINKPFSSVRKILGKQTGYYFNDMVPAYIIGDLSKTRTETWQIIFLPDDSGTVVKEIKIHKKCCYK